MTDEICPVCNRKLEDITECDDCTFEYDSKQPDPTQELDFSEDGDRVYEADFFDGVYDEVYNLEEKIHDT